MKIGFIYIIFIVNPKSLDPLWLWDTDFIYPLYNLAVTMLFQGFDYTFDADSSRTWWEDFVLPLPLSSFKAKGIEDAFNIARPKRLFTLEEKRVQWSLSV